MKRLDIKKTIFFLMAVVFQVIFLINTASANIVVDHDSSQAPIQTIAPPGNFVKTISVSDTSGNAINVNNTGGANGSITINGGITLESVNNSGIYMDGGASLTGLYVNGTLGAGVAGGKALEMLIGTTITAMDNTGTITAGNANQSTVYVLGEVTTLTNSGLIEQTSAVATAALLINNSTTITNEAAGTIHSDAGHAVFFGFGGNATIGSFTNDGTITTDTSDVVRAAVELGDGGFWAKVTTFTNNGTITATASDGMAMETLGTTIGFTNSVGATISGARNGLVLRDGAEFTSFTNDGIIESGGAGVLAGLQLQEDSDIALTNAGTIRNTGGGSALRFDTDDQTNEFTNTGTLSSTTGIAIDADTAVAGGGGLVNSGTITGGGGTAIDAEAAFKLTNTGTVTGSIDHATAGALTIINSDTIDGSITSTADGAHSLTMNSGSITGGVTLDGNTANTFTMVDGTISGTVALGNDIAHAVTLTKGTIGGLDMGAAIGGTATIDTTAGNTFTVNNPGGTALAGQGATFNMTGAGTFIVTGNVVDVGGQADHTFDIDNGTLQFTENSTVDGDIDADGSIVDIGANTVTLNAASNLAADTTLKVTVGTNTGVLSDGTSNSTFTIADGCTLDVTGLGVTRGVDYTIVDATGGTLTSNVANLVVTNGFKAVRIGETIVLTMDIATRVPTRASEFGVDDNIHTALANDEAMNNALNGLSNSARQAAYETMEPEKTPVIKDGSINLMNDTLATVDNRIIAWSKGQAYKGMAAGDKPAKNGQWIKTFASVADQDNRDGYNGFDAESTGISGGIDVELSGVLGDKMLLGMAYCYGVTQLDIKQSNNETNISSHQIAAYGALESDSHLVDSCFSYGFNKYKGLREIKAGNITRYASSNYEGQQWSLSSEYGYKHYFNKMNFMKPTIGFKYISLNVDDYHETGAGATSLIVDKNRYSILSGLVGLNLSTEQIWGGYNFVFDARGHYSYDFNTGPVETISRFSGGGTTFKTIGMDPSPHTGIFGAGVEIAKGEGLELSINYDMTIKEDYIDHNGNISLRYDF